MNDYYIERLSAKRLERCYGIAPPRVRQYLEAELNFVLSKIHSTDLVLELGCGYGRVIPDLARKAKCVIGIDPSKSSLEYGRQFLHSITNYLLLQENALQLSFIDRTFDVVICIQNGISAFHVDQEQLIRESIRVTKPGGTILFSSYSHKFWQHRFEWFQLQAGAGLIGEIDIYQSKNGVIVCKDGFKASTVNRTQFQELTAGLNARTSIVEVDESSLFCVIIPR